MFKPHFPAIEVRFQNDKFSLEVRVDAILLWAIVQVAMVLADQYLKMPSLLS